MKTIFLSFSLIFIVLVTSAQPADLHNRDLIFIYLEGYNENLEYYSNDLVSNFDKDKSRFNFALPVRSIQPKDSLVEDEIIDQVFRPTLYPDILLTFTYHNDIINLKDIRNPETTTVDAILTLQNQVFEVPLSLTLFSDGETLFYGFNFEIDIKRMLQNYSEEYANLLNGNMSFLVEEANWNDFFVQYIERY